MSPQFQRKVHRARRALDAVGHAYPEAWKQFDTFRQQRGQGDFVWPDWCYMPIAGGLACADPHGVQTPTVVGRGVILTALGTWRMTQGIYRFDPGLLQAVLDTPIEGDLPVEHLQRLPEWCVYVDLAGAGIDPELHGAWLHLEHDIARGGVTEFRVVLDIARDPRQPFAPDGLESFGLPLVEGGIEASLDFLFRSAQTMAARLGIDFLPEHAAMVSRQGELVRPLLALALYLCAESDITRRGKPARPTNPPPHRSGTGHWAMHPASGPTEWDVGTRIGAALRAAYDRERAGGDAAPSGRHVRPHVRRAHWHTILSGPRKREDGTEIDPDDRKRSLRWMPPIPVNVEDLDLMPSVIRPVR